VLSDLVAVSEQVDGRTSMVRVLQRDPGAHDDVERCILGMAGEDVECVVLDVSQIPGGLDYALLLRLVRVQRKLGERGIRTALVCCEPDASVLELGYLDRRFLLATSRREALEGLAAADGGDAAAG
jgi:hypothetical protein